MWVCNFQTVHVALLHENRILKTYNTIQRQIYIKQILPILLITSGATGTSMQSQLET